MRMHTVARARELRAFIWRRRLSYAVACAACVLAGWLVGLAAAKTQVENCRATAAYMKGMDV